MFVRFWFQPGGAVVTLRSLANGLLCGWAVLGRDGRFSRVHTYFSFCNFAPVYILLHVFTTPSDDVRAHAVIMCQTRGVAWGANTRDILYGKPPTSHPSRLVFLPFWLRAANQFVGVKVSFGYFWICIVLYFNIITKIQKGRLTRWQYDEKDIPRASQLGRHGGVIKPAWLYMAWHNEVFLIGSRKI